MLLLILQNPPQRILSKVSPDDASRILEQFKNNRRVFTKERQQQKFEILLQEKQAVVSSTNTPHVDKANWHVNPYSRSLSDSETALLKKGLDFAVIPNSIPAAEIIVKIESVIILLDPNKRTLSKGLLTESFKQQNHQSLTSRSRTPWNLAVYPLSPLCIYYLWPLLESFATDGRYKVGSWSIKQTWKWMIIMTMTLVIIVIVNIIMTLTLLASQLSFSNDSFSLLVTFAPQSRLMTLLSSKSWIPSSVQFYHPCHWMLRSISVV